MYGPHFSAGFLCRRISYLEEQLGKMPCGSIFTRNNTQYVKLKWPNSTRYLEKRLQTPDGLKMSGWIALQRKISNDLKFYRAMYNKYYPGTRMINIAIPERILPTPPQMTIEYYNDPPKVENPHKIETPYNVDDSTVRSRFEVIAVETIKELGLDYKNEIPIITPSGTYFMDIVIPVYEKNRCVGFEFCGKSEDTNYINSQIPKVLSYMSVGMIPNHDVVFIMGRKNWLPDTNELKRSIILGVENC